MVQFTLLITVDRTSERHSVNSVRWLHVDSWSCRSLVPNRYVAQSAHSVCVTYLVEQILFIGFRFYECCVELEVGWFL